MKASGCAEFIEKLPNKLETIIGEGGEGLSEGQRQRLSIARALISNPKILLMDEVTSSLDNITEANIIETLLNVKKSVTTIVVAHRLKTVKNADLIIVLGTDGIVESIGSHHYLMKNCQLYQKMYRSGRC